MINHKNELETALKAFLNYLWDNAPEQINLKQEVAEECITSYLNTIPHHNIIGNLSDLETFITKIFLEPLHSKIKNIESLAWQNEIFSVLNKQKEIYLIRLEEKKAVLKQIILKHREIEAAKAQLYTKDQVYRIVANFALTVNTDAYCGGYGNTTDIAADLKKTQDIDFSAPEITS